MNRFHTGQEHEKVVINFTVKIQSMPKVQSVKNYHRQRLEYIFLSLL